MISAFARILYLPGKVIYTMSPELTVNRTRIGSIDILRGAVMLIMALDHVRDFFHWPAFITNPVDLNTTTPAIFFTRWITHFCAPTFVFLSGVSAFISGQRKTRAELSSFLIKRGLWLVVVELVFMTLAITFNPRYNVFILQVIWAIGWSMVILGLLVRTSYKLILVVGAIIFFGHNLLDYASLPRSGSGLIAWQVIFTSPGAFYPLGGGYFTLMAYPILPWTAFMLLGYAFGKLFSPAFTQERRERLILTIGASLLGLFILLRLLNGYGDPAPWSTQKNGLFSVLSFLNVTKYPVSLQYGCLTLGIGLLFLSVLEKFKNRFTDFLTVYGRVPFFYYVLHFYLIHVVCVIFFFASGHGVNEIVDPTSPFLFRPTVYGWSLWVVYPVWLSIILLLYYPCRWFGRYKQTHKQWWLSYL